MKLYDCGHVAERDQGLAAAEEAVKLGQLVVLPTDTVYGVGADAFSPEAVRRLLRAKGRGREAPPPVLIGSKRTLDGLVWVVPGEARELIEAFWPGALTIVLRHAPTLVWDLGETGGTVAFRMPLHPVALELLRETGPLAVSSANLTGEPPAATATAARDQLGSAVSVYLEAGESQSDIPSTIVDFSGDEPRILRAGAISAEQLRDVVPALKAQI